MRKPTPARTRNATATREAILASAREAFTRSGYEGAGVREIAAGAGVTAMMVNRYFGSKEKLFVEVIDRTMQTPFILTPEHLAAPNPAAAFAAALTEVTTPGQTPLDGFLIMFRSASSPIAAELARKQIERRYQRTLAGALLGRAPRARAALALSLVAGLQVMRQILELPSLVDAKPKTLRRLLEAMLRVVFEDTP